MPAARRSELGKLINSDRADIDLVEDHINELLDIELRKKDPKPVTVRFKDMEQWVGHPLDWVVLLQIIADYKSVDDWKVVPFDAAPTGDGGITIS